MSCHSFVMSVGESDDPTGRAHIGPRYEVVGGFSESLHHGVLHDLVRDVEAVRVLDESPAWFAPARIPADCDVGIRFRDNPVPPILRLYRDGLEEKVHGGHETLLGTGAAVLYQAFPEATRDDGKRVARDRTTGERLTLE
jgi:hypothetical protein